MAVYIKKIKQKTKSVKNRWKEIIYASPVCIRHYRDRACTDLRDHNRTAINI